MRQLATITIVALVSLSLGGCTAFLLATGAAAGAGTAIYMQGDLEKILDKDYEHVWVAAQKGMVTRKITITDKQQKSNQGIIKGKASDNASVTVKVIPQTKGQTKVSIRVGVVGNEARSGEILEAIEASL